MLSQFQTRPGIALHTVATPKTEVDRRSQHADHTVALTYNWEPCQLNRAA